MTKLDRQRKSNSLEPFRQVQDVPDLKATIMKLKDYNNTTLLENLARTTDVQALQIKMAIGFQDQDHDDGRDAKTWKQFGDVAKQLQYLEIQKMTSFAMKHLGHMDKLNTLRVDKLGASREIHAKYFASPEQKVDSVMTLLLGAHESFRGGVCLTFEEAPIFSWSRKFANVSNKYISGYQPHLFTLFQLRVLWLGYKRPIFCKGIKSLLSNLGIVSTQCTSLETFCMDNAFIPTWNSYNSAQEQLEAALGAHFACESCPF